MIAYSYAGTRVCFHCADTIAAREAPKYSDRTDARIFPQGPLAEGGGPSDGPEHCDSCGVFLQNPLTESGLRYVREAIARARAMGRDQSVALVDWAPFYEASE